MKWFRNTKGNRIPRNAHSLEVINIKDSANSPTGKVASIFFELKNDEHDIIDVPYTASRWFFPAFCKMSK